MLALRSVAAMLALVLATGPADLRADEAELEVVVLQLAESWPIDYPTHHVQGLCLSDDDVWVSSVSRADQAGWIFRFDRRTLALVAERNIADGELYHPGGMQHRGDVLWVPLAEYRPRSSARVLRLDAKSLATRGTFDVPDHLGALAHDGAGTLYAANWDTRLIYQLNEAGEIVAKRAGPTGVAYQDMEWHDGRLWCVGQTRLEGRPRAVLDVIDPATWRHERRFVLAGKTRSGGDAFGREGFTLFGGAVYVLPEDAPNTTLYRFELPNR